MAVDRIRSGNAPFAIVKREEDEFALILEGEMRTFDTLSEILRPDASSNGEISFNTFSAIPYAQVKEKGVDINDPTPIQCLIVQQQTRVAIDELMKQLPESELQLESDLAYQTSNDAFANNVSSVQRNHIGKGDGSSFTISRKAVAQIKDFNRDALLTMFRSLQTREYGTYMNFLFHTGETSLIGASPERQLSVEDGVVSMNPISGTLRKFPEVTKDRLIEFLNDPKERMELFMVLDEELKQMAQICEKGGSIIGPHLKEMSKVIHTIYHLVGRSNRDIIDMLRMSLCAPTLTGSPERSAHSVIAKHESSFRRYYGGAMVLIGHDANGIEFLDSAITIRTAEIDVKGKMTLQSGATITRASDPAEETKETEGKLAGFLKAIFGEQGTASQQILPLLLDAEVQEILRSRNTELSEYLLRNQYDVDRKVDALVGKTVTVIDNGDDFCHMLKHMMVSMGCEVEVIPFNEYDSSSDSADLVLVGPGPGDPMNEEDPKMQKVAEITLHLLDHDKKFLSVCLGHQILCKQLGMPLECKKEPMQGIQKTVDLFGDQQTVGFYNTYVGKEAGVSGVECASDSETEDVYALRGKRFASFQFHPESILSKNGFHILLQTLQRLIRS